MKMEMSVKKPFSKQLTKPKWDVKLMCVHLCLFRLTRLLHCV